MTKRIVWLSLALAAIAAGALAQPQTEVQVGYRWTNVSGNEDLYRTQINEQDGFILRSLSFFTTAGAAADHFRLDATDLGTGPTSGIRIDTGKTGTYRLRLGYRNFESFSALPAFANPLLGQGIIPGQHTYDRTRTMFDADFELLSLSKITPFIGYSYNRNEGPGRTTYAIGGDEFRLDSDLDENEREIRVGASFDLWKFRGTLVQGWRSLESDEDLTLIAGAGNGNNPGNVGGRPVNAETITRTSNTEIDAPFTNLFLTGNLTSRLNVAANFTRFSAENDGSESESATGNFTSFGLGRFFSGLTESVAANAENDTWRGNLRGEFAFTDAVTFLAGYRAEHREVTGRGLIDSLFRDTITFGGIDRRDIEEILDTENLLERDEGVFSAGVVARPPGPVSFRFEFRNTSQDLTLTPALEEIVVPGNQGGDFEREIRTYDTTVMLAKGPFSATASWRSDSADRAVLRTDYRDRDRIRVRGTFHTPGNLFRIGLTGESTEQENTDNGIGYDASSRLYTADVEVAPLGALRLRAAFARLRADSTILFRRPETFAIDTSRHREDGDSIEAGFGLLFDKFNLDAGVTRFQNEGSLPFDFDRYRLRVGYDFFAHAGVIAEWARDDYEETPAYGRYNAKRLGLFIRYRM